MKDINGYKRFTLAELEKMQDIRRGELDSYLDLVQQSTNDELVLNFFSRRAESAKDELVLLRKEIIRREKPDTYCKVKWVEDEGCGIKNDK